jgi:hypothetical protein
MSDSETEVAELPEITPPEPEETTLPIREVEPDAEVQVEEKEEVEEPEEEEDEEEVEEEDEEEKEDEKLPSKYHRPIFSEIKKEFPDFFKKFPDLRETYFRESKYSTIFPTVEDAEEALAKTEAFDAIDSDLRKGSTKALFDTIFQIDQEAGMKVVENFLPQIYQKSPDLYYGIVSPLIEGFVKNLFN